MGLKFNYEKLMKDFSNYFERDLQIALNAWEIEVRSRIDSNFANKFKGPKFQKNINAWVGSEMSRMKNGIIAYFEANTYVLADSFGTGSLMEIDGNHLFKEYKNSDYWNPLRHGKTIVGRQEGEYKDIFGNIRHTSGVYKGKPIEGMKFHGFEIKPIPPSHALQDAEKRFFITYLPNAIQSTVKKINFSKYLEEY